MRLITYQQDGQARLGAWIHGDADLVDLQHAAGLRGRETPAFASMQALIEAGPAALDTARALADDPPDEAVMQTASVQLLPPVPRPVQMRDALAFELHLRQAKRASARMRLRDNPQAAQEMARLEASGSFEPPAIWRKQPQIGRAHV